MQDRNDSNRNSQSLTTPEAAAFLGLSRKTLDSWRRFGRGPAFIKMGAAIRYRIADLITFQERHKVEPENC